MNTVSRILSALLIGLVTQACSDSNNDQVTGEGTLRALHAIPDLGTVDFLIEETFLGSVEFKQSTGISEYDDLEYEFNFDTFLPGESETTRLLTTTLSVNRETDYIFALTGSFADPEIVLWEQFGRDWAQEIEDADENDTEVTVMEVSFGHVAPSVGQVDMYLEVPGTSPLAAVPKATLGDRGFQAAIELPEGEYQLVITPANVPDTILFASDPIDIVAASSSLFVVIDDGGETTADFSVRLLGPGVATTLVDLDLDAELTLYHAAFGTDGVDVVSGDGFVAPLVEDLRFNVESAPVSIEDDAIDLTVTPSDNNGVFLAQQQFTIVPGSYNRVFLVGLPGLLQAARLRFDKRRLATHARLQVFQGAARFQTLDIYIIDEDADIELLSPTYSSFLFGTGTSLTSFEPEGYNIVLTEPGNKNIIAGPLATDLVAGRNYLLVVTDGDNITAVDMSLFDRTEE